MDIQLSYEFIDDHMAKANGDFLKVYLYTLRHRDAPPGIEETADALNMTEKDVQRAIAYWQKEGLWDGGTERREVDVAGLSEDMEFRALLHALQNYMGKRFTGNDAEILGYMYDQLGLSTDLIEYLFELCKQKGKTSLRYIEKVAQSWYAKGIRTVDDAKNDSSLFAAEINAVKENLGVGSRDLAKPEIDFILKWLREWKIPADLVCEACRRTVLSTGKASFNYADSILKSWHDAGVTTRAQLADRDREYADARSEHSAQSGTVYQGTAGASGQQVQPVSSGRSRSAQNPGNRFHNFTERKPSEDNKDLDSDVMDKFNDLFK